MKGGNMDSKKKLDATLYTKDGRAEVVLSDHDSGERVGVHTFGTLDEALEWLASMKKSYKVAA